MLGLLLPLVFQCSFRLVTLVVLLLLQYCACVCVSMAIKEVPRDVVSRSRTDIGEQGERQERESTPTQIMTHLVDQLLSLELLCLGQEIFHNGLPRVDVA